MRKLLFSFLLLLSISPAAAQNPTCPTRPFGTSDNSCASTAFVQAGITGLGLQPINITAPPYNAVCSGGAGSDQASAIQAAIDATPTGGALYIPACRTAGQVYDLVGSGSCILTVTKAIRIYGDGQGSILFPHASVPNTRDILCVTPASSASGYQFNSFEIISAGGRHALHFNIPLGTLITRVSIEHLFIPVTTAGGNSIRVTNDAATASGGMAYSNISHNNLESVYFDTIGDGIVVDNNVIGTSATSTNFAVRASFVAGAGGFTVGPGNVIAGFSCLVCIVNGNGVTLLDNYIETAGANSYGFLIDMNTSGGTMLSPQMLGNQYSVTTGLPIPVRIRAGTQNARLADKHSIIQIGGTHIQVDATATDTSIDRNTQWITAGGVGVTPVITDNGTRTGYTQYLADGAVGTPSLAFLGDTDTGIYRPSANIIGFSTGGSSLATMSLASGFTVLGNITLNTNAAAVPALPSDIGAGFRLQGLDNTSTAIIITAYGAGQFPIYEGFLARGTAAAKTVVQADDNLLILVGHGWDGTDFRGSAQIRFQAAETFSSTTSGTQLEFKTVPIGGAFSDLTRRFFISANGLVGVGTTTPQAMLHVNANTVNSSTSTGTIVQLTGADSTNTQLQINTFGAAGNQVGRLLMQQSAGTAASPSQIQAAAIIGQLLFAGFTNASAYGQSAEIRVTTVEAYTATAQGNFMTFYTAATGALKAESMRLQGSGGLSIGTTTDPGVGGIQVNGQQFNPNMVSDTATTDNTVCTATTGGKLLKGTGALGICLGTSGRQFKTAFAPMRGGLSDLMKIDFWNYRYLPGYGDDGERLQYGPTAQGVEAALPDLARHSVRGETINYDSGALLFIGLRAIQELKADNDNLRAEVLEIKRRAK